MATSSSSSSSSDCSDDEGKSSEHSYEGNRNTSRHDQLNAVKSVPVNSFKNDGSFLEMFKKMQEQYSQNSENEVKNSNSNLGPEVSSAAGANPVTGSSNSPDSAVSSDSSNDKINRFVGKRRPARVLPTGLVKKQKKEAETSKQRPHEKKNDPWTKYMDEVKKYKQQSCTEEEGSRRPLVK